MSKTALLLFRKDLRLQDNAALKAAVLDGYQIVPVYIHEDQACDLSNGGGALKWWLHHALSDLDTQLREYGSCLILRSGDYGSQLTKLIEAYQCERIYASSAFDPDGIHRVEKIKQVAQGAGVDLLLHNNHLLAHPEQLLNQSGLPYRVFTPYWNAFQMQELAKPFYVELKSAYFLQGVSCDGGVSNLHLLPYVKWYKGMEAAWKPTRESAITEWRQWLEEDHLGYAKNRDYPDISATSRMSPYLCCGQIGVRELWWDISARNSRPRSDSDLLAYRRQLAWREFAQSILYHFPYTINKPFRPEFEKFPYLDDRVAFKQWARGETGYPIIDAAMRELWSSGWMHNRMRMVVASFLTKHLLLDWKEGAAWFMDTLVDADVGNNLMGWQWVAGCGVDAAPYFRIFNPLTQGEKWDAQASYIRKWMPELRALGNKAIHQPWRAASNVLAGAGVTLGKTYPYPMIDAADGRKRALKAYELFKMEVKR